MNASYARAAATGNHGRQTEEVVDIELQRALAQIERQERDSIRQEQDNAYQQSLKADREKQLKREEELARKMNEEREKEERLLRQKLMNERLLELKQSIPKHLEAELSKTKKESTPVQAEKSDDELVKLVFKLPDGTRVKKDFRKDDRVKLLYWFVFSLEKAPMSFRMTTNFPKRDLPGRPPIPEDFGPAHPDLEPICKEPNCELMLDEVGLTGSQILFVCDLEA